MEKVASFTDADVEKLAEPLRPLVGASQGLQVWDRHLTGLLAQLCLPILMLGLSSEVYPDVSLICSGPRCSKEPDAAGGPQ